MIISAGTVNCGGSLNHFSWIDTERTTDNPESRYSGQYGFGMDDYGNAVMLEKGEMPYFAL